MFAGSCLCGQVQYRIDGPVKRASHCYCTMCRKQHGAACGSYANVASADFVYTSGAGAVVAYASSPGVARSFCGRCGSTLSWQMDAHKDRIAVALGTFDTPYPEAVTEELFAENKPNWMPVKS